MNPIYRQMIRSSVLGTLALAAMVFIPAGTLNYWQGWAYLGTSIFASALYTIYLVKYDPALLQRRQQAGPSHEKEPAQKIISVLIFAALVMLIVLSALDYRFGWSPVPWYVSVVGDALVALSFYFFYLVSKVNSYAAANVRVEEGQRVVDTGVYGLVRHPMYFGALFLIAGTPPALGSWWTLLLTPVSLPLLYFRIANEEKVLMRDLAGCGLSTESQISPHPVRLVSFADYVPFFFPSTFAFPFAGFGFAASASRSAASFASRSSRSFAVRSRRARPAASYSAMATLPSRACSALRLKLASAFAWASLDGLLKKISSS